MTAASRAAGAEPPLDPYAAILAHAELELELAGAGQTAELLRLSAVWERLIAGLPPSPPHAAASLLERALLIHERTRIELIRLREAVQAEHRTARRARRTAAGYAGEGRRAAVLDRSA